MLITVDKYGEKQKMFISYPGYTKTVNKEYR